MPYFLTRTEVREVDRRAIEEFGLPGLVLMENAGRSAAELLRDKLRTYPRVTIVCGKGNNAGDGFVIARHLEIHGVEVEVLLASPAERLSGDAAVFCQVIAKSGISIRDLSAADRSHWIEALGNADDGWIVDALLGTGLVGPAREPFSTAIDAINESKRPVFAVDVPSGLDCDTGVPAGAGVRAKLTGTFVVSKIGFDNPASRQWTGEVHVLDIGVPAKLRRDLLSA